MYGNQNHVIGRRGFLTGAGAAATGVVLGGCGTARGGTGSKKSLDIVIVPKWTTLSYFQRAKVGAKKAAAELGDTLTYTGPANPNSEEQVATLQSVIAQLPDVILIAALQANNVAPVLKRAMRQGITVVTYDSDSTPSARRLFVNQLSFQTAAQAYLDAALANDPRGGEVIFLAATPTTANHTGQINAMKNLIARGGKYASLKAGGTYYVEDDVAKSVDTTTNILQSDPQAKYIISPSVVSVPAAAQAIGAAGKSGKVFATGAALPGDIRQYLRGNSEKEFVLWDPANLGYVATYAGHLLHTGSLKPAPGKSFSAGSLGAYMITSENIVNYDKPLTFTANNINDYQW
jgi:rhamnose transport system substrate-binding protein